MLRLVKKQRCCDTRHIVHTRRTGPVWHAGHKFGMLDVDATRRTKMRPNGRNAAQRVHAASSSFAAHRT
eukprot:359185-Chlamydomonas_euryale.AAC.6